MFEHVRAAWTAELSQAQAGITAAAAARDAAQLDLDTRRATLPGLQSALDAATATVNARNGELATADAVLTQRSAERQAAQTALDQARQVLADHLDNEPPETTTRDKPNPAWGAWDRKRQQLAANVQAAQTALNAAVTAQQAAQQSRDGAAGAAAGAAATKDQAQTAVGDAQAGVTAAEQRLVTAQAGIPAAQQAADAVAARIAGLDARGAGLQAEPLDRATLEPAADAELADLEVTWQRRHDALARQGAAVAERAGVLAEHDRAVDDLAALRAEMAAWPDFGRWPPLAGVVSGLDAVLQANQAQRGRPVTARDDDLWAARLQLANQIGELERVATKAGAERDGATSFLANAADALQRHQQKEP